jgi:hypothetical protein
MPEEEALKPPKSANAPDAVRKILRKHFRKLTKILLTRNCHRVFEDQIEELIVMLELLQREARRKTPSKEYRQFCHNLAPTTRLPVSGISASRSASRSRSTSAAKKANRRTSSTTRGGNPTRNKSRRFFSSWSRVGILAASDCTRQKARDGIIRQP